MSKRILVTGAFGLIGYAIQNVIKEENPEDEEWFFVRSKDGDLSDINETRALFEKYRPTHVIHLAAMVGGLYNNMKDNLNFFRRNMHINDNVLFISHEYNVEKVMSCLSTCIFPDKTSYPITEEMLHNGPPHDSNYGYSYAKRMVTVLNRAYYEKYGRIYTCGAPCNLYGPHDNYVYGDSHIVPGLISRMYDTIYLQDPDKPTEEKEFVVWGSGKAQRMFLFSKDLAKILIWFTRYYNNIEPVIFCPDEKDEVTISDVVHIVAKAFNFKGKIVYDLTKSDGQLKKTTSNAKLKSLMPNFKFTNLEEGLKEAVDWYIENYKTARR